MSRKHKYIAAVGIGVVLYSLLWSELVPFLRNTYCTQFTIQEIPVFYECTNHLIWMIAGQTSPLNTVWGIITIHLMVILVVLNVGVLTHAIMKRIGAEFRNEPER